ncbi:MAG: hypothetical protein J7501_15935 [Bdellovibrio sp.]|nr:hypothetical protein [Bdellovibrio sp.]
MKKVLCFQALVSALGVLLLAIFAASSQAVSFLVGSGLILLSFFLLGIGWSLIFKKKLIALAVGIIVFKYAILGIIIFTIVKRPWFDPLWFAMGVASFVLSAIFYAVMQSLDEAKNEGNENVI